MKKVNHKVVVVVVDAVDKICVLSLFSAANHDHTHYLLPFVVSSCWSLLLLLLLSYVFTVFLSFCSLNRFVSVFDLIVVTNADDDTRLN